MVRVARVDAPRRPRGGGGGGRHAPERHQAATRAAWAVDTVRRARACHEKQDYDAAIKFCEQAMDLDASYVASYTLRGAALAKKRKYGDACRDFRTALKLDPANENARRYLEKVEKEHPQSSGKVSMMGGSGRPGGSPRLEREDGRAKASPEPDAHAEPSALYKDGARARNRRRGGTRTSGDARSASATTGETGGTESATSDTGAIVTIAIAVASVIRVSYR